MVILDRIRKALRRKALLREAAKVEAQAKEARRSFIHTLSGLTGPTVVLFTTMALATQVCGSVEASDAAKVMSNMMFGHDDELVQKLESKAKVLRAEAESLRG